MVDPARREMVRYAILLAAVAAAGMAASWFTYRSLVGREDRIAYAQFEHDASRLSGSIQRDLNANLKVANALVAFYDASEKVDRREFRQFARRLLADRAEIVCLAWAPRVALPDRAAHEQIARSEGLAGYQIVERGANGAPRPAAERPRYFPVFYCEPVIPGLMGLDLASTPPFEKAIEAAVQTAAVDIRGRVRLDLGEGADEVCLLAAPVFRPAHDAPHNGPADDQPRDDDVVGAVVAVCRLDVLLADAVLRQRPEVMQVLLVGRSEEGPDVLARYPALSSPTPLVDDPSAPKYLTPLADLPWHDWAVLCVADPSFVLQRRSWLPAVIGLGGVLLSGVVAGLVGVLVGQADRVRAQVLRRTAELQHAKEQLEREVAHHAKTQDHLRNSHALYTSLVETLPLFLLRKDLEGRFTFANQSFCRLLGKSAAEIVGKTDFDFFPPPLAEKYRQDDRRVIESNQVFKDVEQHLHEGETRYVEVWKSPVYDAAGAIIGTQAVFWDVTERIRTQMALDQERYLLTALMDHVPDSIFFKDAEGRFLRINNALAGRFGLSDPGEAVGKTDFDFFSAEHAEHARRVEEQVMRSGRPVVALEELETWPDGRSAWVSTTKLPLRDPQGKVIGTFGVARDITQQRQAAEALRLAKEAAEAASRAKSDFLANMSHEIRTPLNAVIGMTELLLDMEMNKTQQEYLRIIRESGEALLAVINDILDFSKIEAGKLELDLAEFPLRERLGDTMKSLGLRAHAKGLELAWRVHPDTPDGLIGDVGRLRQVVINLVGNAIKFTERGEVVLDVETESQESGRVTLHFAVRDTGVGVPADRMEAIFQEFEQADTSTTRRYGGTGLGLAISSRLVDCMGGRMWAESEPGRGSTFHFTARFEVAYQQAKEPVARGTSLVGLRVLVVDDNATNRRILEEMLRNWQMQPTMAASAAEALDALAAAVRRDEPLHLVLADGHMPRTDGFALVEQIRRAQGPAEPVILMLTSGDRPDDLRRCERLGIAAHLIKPIKQSELFDAIVHALDVAVEPVEPAEQTEPAVRLPPLTVLLAEDSVVNQKLAVGLLQRQGHRVVVADNGRAALEAWRRQRFDLILMDIRMPEMDGLETTAAIRREEQHRGGHTPIVAMTAHAMQRDRQQCLDAGMDAYLSKPIRASRLFATIAEVLSERRADATAPAADDAVPVANLSAAADDDSTAFPSRPTGNAPPPDIVATGADAVDWQLACSGVRGDSALLRSLAVALLDEAPRLLATLHDAVERGDAKAVHIAAHALKGGVRHFGAQTAFALALELEMQGRDGNLSGARPLLAALGAELTRVADALRSFLATG